MKQHNVVFYQNRQQAGSLGLSVEEMQDQWFGDWDQLEWDHSYIQWLFPIAEKGMNYDSYQLTEREAQTVRETPELQIRVIGSYRMMLDFYGLVLADEESGEVERNPETWKGRLHALNHSYHNYLRITRILKCLGLVGLEHYKRPLLHHLILEIFQEGTLRNARDSCVKYWVHTLRDPKDQYEIDELLQHWSCLRVGHGDETHKRNCWSVRCYTPTVAGWRVHEGLSREVRTHDCDPYSSKRRRFSRQQKSHRSYHNGAGDDRPRFSHGFGFGIGTGFGL